MALFRSVVTVGSYTLLSRIFGFVRDILIAATLGAGPVSDAFFVAFQLPNLFRRLFAEGAFSAAFVPLFTGTLTTDGRDAAIRFAEQALSVLVVVLFLFVLAAQVFMPDVIHVLAPGFAAYPTKFHLAVVFTRLTFPYLLFISLVALLGGTLNAVGLFAAPAAAPIILNLCLIAALLLATPYLPTAGHALAWGVAAAGILQFLWLIGACGRAGLHFRLPRPRLTPQVKRLLRLMLPAALGAGASQVNQMVNLILASLLPAGSISYLFYADRLEQLPLGVVGVALGTALLPLLSRQLAAGDIKSAVQSQNRALELALLLALPAAAGLSVLAFPLISVLFQRGAFSAAASVATSHVLIAYAAGLPAFVMIKVFTPGFYARRDTRTPLIVAVIAVATNITLNLILMRPLLYVGLAISLSTASWLQTMILASLLYRRGHWRPDRRLADRGARILAVTLGMAIGLAGFARLLAPWLLQGELRRIVALGLLVSFGLVAYVVLAEISGAARLAELKRQLRPRPG